MCQNSTFILPYSGQADKVLYAKMSRGRNISHGQEERGGQISLHEGARGLHNNKFLQLYGPFFPSILLTVKAEGGRVGTVCTL